MKSSKTENEGPGEFLTFFFIMLILSAVAGVAIGTVSALQGISPVNPFLSMNTLSTFLRNAFCGFLFFVALLTMMIGVGLMMITPPRELPGIGPLFIFVGIGLLFFMFSLCK